MKGKLIREVWRNIVNGRNLDTPHRPVPSVLILILILLLILILILLLILLLLLLLILILILLLLLVLLFLLILLPISRPIPRKLGEGLLYRHGERCTIVPDVSLVSHTLEGKKFVLRKRVRSALGSLEVSILNRFASLMAGG